MEREQLDEQVEFLNQQVGVLLEYTQRSVSDADTEPLLMAIEELNVALEELQVVQAELFEQNQALAQAQETIEEERRRYQDLFEFAPDGYLVTTPDGVIREANRAAADMLGISPARMIGKPFIIFVAVDERQTFRRNLMQLEHEHRQEWVVQLQPRGELPFEATLTVTVVEGGHGGIVGLRWLLHDTTERQQLEEARLKVRLAEMVNRDLADELVQRQQLEEALHQQAAALMQANRMKDEFLAVVSHELRSPLNPILGWAELLQSRSLEETQVDRALDTIKRNAKLQAQLIDDLLDISRIIQGKLSLQSHPVNLKAVLTEALDTVQLAAQAKTIDLQFTLAPSEFIVFGDFNRLQQVVWNLLSNAIKFTPKQGQVEMRLEQAQGEVVITIRDTGCGISSELLPYLFERFWQAERVTTRSHGGLGLGLTIARHLVEMHGGTIEASSLGVGQGSTFVVRLPLRVDLPAARSTEAAPVATAVQLERLHVLIVDDQPDAQAILTAVLEQAGARVTAVASVEQALHAVAHCQFDILISDIGMPEQDGYALIRQIRAMPTEALRRLPAIALSAYAAADDRLQAIAAGFNEHLPKPIEPNLLISIVAAQVVR
ncbi:response regulator [Phormidium tenue FACHB-886]|nr:response regulator [Phormidium tenue FACHB-886]